MIIRAWIPDDSNKGKTKRNGSSPSFELLLSALNRSKLLMDCPYVCGIKVPHNVEADKTLHQRLAATLGHQVHTPRQTIHTLPMPSVPDLASAPNGLSGKVLARA